MDTVLGVVVLMWLPVWGVCQSGSGAIDQLESCPTLAGGLSSFHPSLDAYIEDRSSLCACTVATNAVCVCVCVCVCVHCSHQCCVCVYVCVRVRAL